VESFQRIIDLHRLDNNPELFAITLAISYIHSLIRYAGSNLVSPDNASALGPRHLQWFITRTTGITWKNNRFAQEAFDLSDT